MMWPFTGCQHHWEHIEDETKPNLKYDTPHFDIVSHIFCSKCDKLKKVSLEDWRRIEKKQKKKPECDHHWHFLTHTTLYMHSFDIDGEDGCLIFCSKCGIERQVYLERWHIIKKKQEILAQVAKEKAQEGLCPHGDDWDDCPDCRH